METPPATTSGVALQRSQPRHDVPARLEPRRSVGSGRDWRLALANLAIHLATDWLYDFLRDSVYYVASARHPAWENVDDPPITPMWRA